VGLVVAMLLCSDRESRDYLLGHGRVLSVVSIGILFLVLAMTVVGWRLSC
jgi:divalent metal cation (Fe/Co/Zn/Cd) transporter